MSDDAHQDDELFVTDSDEVAEGDESTTELELDEEIKEKPNKSQDANAVQKGTIESLQRKLDSGEITLKDIPKQQKWAVKYLTVEKSEASSGLTIKDMEKLLEKRENDQKFASLKEKLNSASLKKDQKVTLQAEFRELTAHGVPSAKALEKAMALAGISLEDNSSKKAAMRIPTPGYVQPRTESDENPYAGADDNEYQPPKGTPEERIAFMKKQMNSGQSKKVWEK